MKGKDATVEKLLKVWAKKRDPESWAVLNDYLAETLPDPSLEALEAAKEQLKNSVDQGIRREQMEFVAHEEGNLETEPLLIQPLSMEAPPRQQIPVELRVDGRRVIVYVSVSADHLSHIESVEFEGGDPLPGSTRGTTPRIFRERNEDWGTFVRRLPFELDVIPITARAVELAGDSIVPWIGLDGEVFYPAGEPYRYVRWMSRAPEWLERELRDYDCITLYTVGGGFQTGPMPAFVDVENEVLYQLVRESAHGAEVECPFARWDPEEREETRDIRRVTEEDTYYGEYPLKNCRFCEGGIGEEHGYVYVGEGGEYVYARVDRENDE